MGGAAKKAKDVVTNPKAAAGVVAAPFTGGASLALTGKEMYDERKEKKKEAREEAERNAVLEQKRQEEERKKTKMESLAERKQKSSGLASLVGSGNSTLG